MLATAAAFVCVLTLAHAANTNGRIKGVVTDAQGAVIANVQVTATNNATSVKFETQSGTDGNFLFPELPIGSYTVAASSTGFKSFTATGIVLNIDQVYVENIQLQVGSTNEVVEVKASSVQVDTTDMQLSNIVNSDQMVELPLINRNFTGLELALPGVQGASDRFTGNYSVSGAQSQQSAYLINGADTNDIVLNTLVIAPNLDAIDQFNLIEGPLNAEYDRNSGGIVSATIKQGSNSFHGDAFEFYRDTFLNTANFFNHTVGTSTSPSHPIVPTYHQNIFGGTLGGPVVKQKLFFFTAYQGTRQAVPQTGSVNGSTYGNVNVLSGAMQAGDFSVNNPATVGTKPGNPVGSTCPTWGGWACDPIPSTVIALLPKCAADTTWAQCAFDYQGKFPVSSFNSISKTMLKYVPAPNSGTYGYVFSPTVTTSNDQYIGRVDFSLNPANQLYGLFIIVKQNQPETLPFTGANVPGFGDVSKSSTNQITFDYVHQFTPTMVNDFAAHYTRFNFDAVEPQKPVAPSSVGFNITPQDTAGQGLPLMTIVSPSGVNFVLGFSSNGPQPRIDQVIQGDDNLSKVVGQHSFKFGYDGRRFNVSNPFGASNNGNYGFNPSNSTYSTGDGALDFLLGIPGTYLQGSGATIQASAFLNYIYGQDSWKVTDSLTLNYGLAYSIDTVLHQHQFDGEGIACLIPGLQSKVFPTAPLSVAYPGDGACTNSALATTRYDELGPRVGFAWAPDLGRFSGQRGGFSIRGGFGIYYNRTEEESSLQTLQTPPFGLQSLGAADFGGSPSLANPYLDIDAGGSSPNKFPYKFPTKGQNLGPDVWGALEPLIISSYGPTFRAPYAMNFQLSVEREFPSRLLARVSYVGALGRHNQVVYEGNAESAAGHAACLAGNEFSPFAGKVISCSSSANRNNQALLFPQNMVYGAADKANQGIDPTTGVTGLTSIGTVDSFASSSYHSLQAEARKTMTHGLTFQLSYTYSHALDNGSSFENTGYGNSGQRGWNQYVKSLNYGDSLFDARHRFVFSPIYVIPRFSGSSSLSFKNLAIAGWEVSAITVVATGFPYDISYAGATSLSLYCSANSGFYACPDVPNQVTSATFGNPRVRNSSGSSNYITNAQAKFSPPGGVAFTPEVLGTFGNTHRNPYHGPGINNTNMILAKNFVIVPERNVSIQIRMESDNVFNHTQFNNPTSSFTSGNFGVITGAASARQTQLAAKVYF
jgi:hypothetical protein